MWLDDLAGIVAFTQNRKQFLATTFGIHCLPSKATFCRVLAMLDADAIIPIIITIMKEKREVLGDMIAVDGKAIRSTSKAGKPHSALQILTAYFVESGVVLGQEALEEKTNEIPVRWLCNWTQKESKNIV